MAKSASFSWELMFTRSVLGAAGIIEQHHLLTAVAALIDAGTVRTTSGEVFGTIDASTLRRAHAWIETGRTIGKLVLEDWPASS